MKAEADGSGLRQHDFDDVTISGESIAVFCTRKEEATCDTHSIDQHGMVHPRCSPGPGTVRRASVGLARCGPWERGTHGLSHRTHATQQRTALRVLGAVM